MFLTFEGGEGVGKTTLISSVQMYLVSKGYQVLVTREPGGTELGKKIRTILLENKEIQLSKRAELFLFLADRSQHVETVINPFLKKGGIVLCDRFIDSTYAYQKESFEFKDLSLLNMFATMNLSPYKTFYLDLDPEEGMKRIQLDRKTPLDKMEKKGLQFHSKVRSNFLELVELFPQRIIKVDASKSKEHVFEQVKKMLETLLNQK